MPHFHRSPLTAGLLTRGLLCATLAVAAAQNPVPEKDKDPDKEEATGFLQGDLFPDNSVLKRVILPSFNLDLQLVNTLTAEEMTIVTKKDIEAKNVKIDFFGPNRTHRGTIDLKKAAFNASDKILRSKDPVSFVSEKLNLDGTSLDFDTENNRGFLHGPVKAVSKSPPRTSMNVSPARKAIAAGTMLMASAMQAPAQEEAPKALDVPVLTENMSSEEKQAALQPTEERLARMKEEAASRAPQVATARETAEKLLADAHDKSEGARITMNSFFQAAAMPAMLAETAPEPVGPVPRPVLDEMQIGEKTTITSDGGGFIDNNEGLIVFLKNVKVVNPEFTMTAQKELKVFRKTDPAAEGSKAAKRAEMEKIAAEKAARQAAGQDPVVQPPPKEGTTPAPAPAPTEGAAPAPGEGADKAEKPPVDPELAAKWKAEKDKKKAGGLGGESEISRLMASGTVMIDYKPKEEGKKPMKAAAHLVVYDFEKEEILLQGGSPWALIDGNPVSVAGDNAYIVVTLKDGQPLYAVTKGGSLTAEMQLKDMKEKPKDGNKPNNGPKPPNSGDKPKNR
ncbi:hypothetical protein [Luteolibacter sp. Populi]|uniref:hypothetical protein n=1 Tax=Luteolibacter sp. Populi TaxID=3230487 RepID=UPI003467D6A3